MKFRSRQSGATIWQMITIGFLVVIFALLLMKLLPPYLSDLKISSALSSLQKQAAASAMNKREILIALEKRFDIDDVRGIDLRQDVIIEKHGRLATVTIDYEVQVPLLFNISALMEFNHSVQVASSD
jgi:Domain of unknown function (DUF4845)